MPAEALRNRRLFIIEDNVDNLVIMQLLLERAGAKIGVERWGTTTLERLARFRPVDLVLLDLQFPNGVSGFDIFDQIQSTPEFAEVPIVAVSAGEVAVNLPKVKEKGFAGFIAKPIDYDRFAEYITSVLEGNLIWITT